MVEKCPNVSCSRSLSSRTVRDGFFYRKDDARFVQRFRCRLCFKRFSLATLDVCIGQHKRSVNHVLARQLSSSVSMRRCSLLLGITRNTVARKLLFLGSQARIALEKERANLGVIAEFEFDELETYEHSRYKPLSVVAAVIPKQRKILGFEVASMPAKGLLVETSRKKYGWRRDDRRKAIQKLFSRLRTFIRCSFVRTIPLDIQ